VLESGSFSLGWLNLEGRVVKARVSLSIRSTRGSAVEIAGAGQAGNIVG
jgi:hypothetical protein